MSSPQGENDVVDVTMEGEHSQEEEETGELAAGEEEHKQEENEDDDVQFVGSEEASIGQEDTKQEDDVEILESVTSRSTSAEQSRAKTDAIMAAKGFVTPATLEAELQCIICQYAMFKPVSAICGHSFCRVCLMDSILTRSIEEAECPICRVDILQPFSAKTSLASVFYVNVTLWNLVQLLIPSVVKRIATQQDEEAQEYKQKLDQLDAKWKIITLSERAASYHADHDEEERGSLARWEEDHEGHEEYPVLKFEDTQDGNLHVSRNIVLDTNDENEDGYVNMRVGIAIVEFPSIFELYNEHQECTVNVIKMEEDEEMVDGMPFFMNESGDDDGFVCGSYYNEISLRICDEAGNCVMERTRGAQGGVVTFPSLRLDVPGGLYTFRFSDDLYGLKLSITTRLREPHEISDTPVADYVSLVNEEARDAGRRNRSRTHDSDNEDVYGEEGNESDSSFIVDDLNGEVHNEEPVGCFSDDEDEGEWQFQSDEEAADEAREQRRVRRQQRSRRRSERDVQFVGEHEEEEELSGEEEEHEGCDGDGYIDEHEADEDVDEVRPGRRNVRVVEEAALSSDGEADQEEHDGVDAVKDEGKEEEQHETHELSRPRRRNTNQIVDSEDEDEGESDEEEKENDVGDDANEEHNEQKSNNNQEIVVEDNGEDEDTMTRNSGRKVTRAQWFQGDESDEDTQQHPDAVFFPHEEDEIVQRRPQKRARTRDRQVRVIDEGESDEEQEQMERSIVAANSEHVHDDEDDDDDDLFRRVRLCDEESDERHEYEDALPDADYPDRDEENDLQAEQDDEY